MENILNKKAEEIKSAVKSDKRFTVKENALSFHSKRTFLLTFYIAKLKQDADVKSALLEIVNKILPAKTFKLKLHARGNVNVAEIEIVSTLEEEVMFE